MNSYIFNRNIFDKYYNCSNAATAPPAEREPSVILGYGFIVTFAVFELLYIPFIFVLLQPYYRAKSCYKFMHAISVIDLCTMPMNGGLTGYVFIKGASYCDYPMLNLYAGALGNVFWMGQSMLTVFLALDRCVSMMSPWYSNILFSGLKPYAWISVAVGYMVICFLTTKSVFFNATIGVWLFDPLLGHEGFSYRNYVHSIHNFSVPILLAVLYLLFASSLLRKKLITSNSTEITRVVSSEASVFLQVFIIALVNFVFALLYDFAQFVPISTSMIKACSYGWLCVHGLPSILYLTNNKRLRKDVLRLLKLQGVLGVSNAVSSTNSMLSKTPQTGDISKTANATQN